MAGQVARGTPSQDMAQSQPASPWASVCPKWGTHSSSLPPAPSRTQPSRTMALQHTDPAGLLTVPAMSPVSPQPSPPAAGLPLSWLPAPARVSP